jgi:hypothetical protein
VDLVKAYDTANHDLLLFRLLEKYGPPPHLSPQLERSTHPTWQC